MQMKRFILRATAILIFIAISFSVLSCGEQGEDYCRIDGKNIYFVTEEEKEAWRGPLEKLLSNEERPFYSDDAIGALMGYEAPDPDSPAIADGYACALFDVNLDGIPELWVDLGGGSAGNSFYEVYDIYTGEELGTVDGGQGGAFCVYFDAEEGKLKNIARYTWRYGWDTRLLFINEISFSEESKKVTEKMYFYTRYHLDMPLISQNTYDEVCSDFRYNVYGEDVDLDTYLSESERFESNCIRIRETAMEYVCWRNVAEDDDPPSVRGKKMAEALLSSGQKFVLNK